MGTTKANRARHARIREVPSRQKHLLREAVADSGLRVLGYEYEIESPLGYPVWYDVAVTLGTGTGLIFLADRHRHSPDTSVWSGGRVNYNQRARDRKIATAKALSIPFVEVWPTSQLRMRAQIELWMMTYTKLPYQDTTLNPPKDIDKVYRRPFKSRRVT